MYNHVPTGSFPITCAVLPNYLCCIVQLPIGTFKPVFMMDFYNTIRRFFILLKADRELRQIIKQADRMYLRTGRRYYVLPNARHELHAWCWADIKRMRRAGMFSNRATQRDFLFECFYHTRGQFGEGALTPQRRKQKRRAWLNYVAQVRRLV